MHDNVTVIICIVICILSRWGSLLHQPIYSVKVPEIGDESDY